MAYAQQLGPVDGDYPEPGRDTGRDERRRTAVDREASTPVLASALAYHDGLRAERSPANLIQALRDEFGAYGYRHFGERKPAYRLVRGWDRAQVTASIDSEGFCATLRVDQAVLTTWPRLKTILAFIRNGRGGRSEDR